MPLPLPLPLPRLPEKKLSAQKPQNLLELVIQDVPEEAKVDHWQKQLGIPRQELGGVPKEARVDLATVVQGVPDQARYDVPKPELLDVPEQEQMIFPG